MALEDNLQLPLQTNEKPTVWRQITVVHVGRSNLHCQLCVQQNPTLDSTLHYSTQITFRLKAGYITAHNFLFTCLHSHSTT